MAARISWRDVTTVCCEVLEFLSRRHRRATAPDRRPVAERSARPAGRRATRGNARPNWSGTDHAIRCAHRAFRSTACGEMTNNTVIWDLSDGHTYVTTPGSAWLFASLCVPTGDLPPAVAGPARCGDRAAMMPTRTQNRATETPPPHPDEPAAVLATMFWNPRGRLRIRRGRQAPAAAVPGAGRQGVGWRG